MKTSEIKINASYLFTDTNEIVTVLEKIKGKIVNKPNMQSGIMFTNYKREQKSFRLSNGLIVKANKLKSI